MVKFQVHIEMSMKMAIFCDVAPYNLVYIHTNDRGSKLLWNEDATSHKAAIHSNEPLKEISWLAQQLLDYQGRLCSMEFVNLYGHVREAYCHTINPGVKESSWQPLV